MSKESEIKSFESRFLREVIEIDAVTGMSGFSGGIGSGSVMWSGLIDIIAWKIHGHSSSKIIKEKYTLNALVDYDNFKKLQKIVAGNSIIRLKVCMSKDDSLHCFKLVEFIDISYKDNELEKILQEELKPVFYEDKIFGKMELDKRVDTFESRINWMESNVHIMINNNKDENVIKDCISTAHELYNNQKKWNEKILNYSAQELLDLANDWYEDSREEYYEDFDPNFEEEDPFFKYEEILKERFIELIEISEICVESDGNFSIFCSDGDIFLGHCIIVSGNINGEFKDAVMAG